MASQITSFTIAYSIVLSGTDQRKHQSSASMAFVRGIHRWPVNSPHKWPVTRKMFPFDDLIISSSGINQVFSHYSGLNTRGVNRLSIQQSLYSYVSIWLVPVTLKVAPQNAQRIMVRKRWRATAWCGKSKFAISSGWLTNGSLCHPDDITALS